MFLLLYVSFINAQNKIKLVAFSSGYTEITGLENCGDSRLFVIDQEGKIFISDSNGNQFKKPYLDITDRVLFGGERGLLGLAFDPNYLTNGYFYLNYTNASGNTQISRFKVKAGNPNVADKNSEKFILEVAQPFTNHKGGCTRFGKDGYLYIGMGDGGSGGDPNNNAQNPMSLLGKMLRIDVHSGKQPYKIPADNPFVDSANYRPEIWALGYRNPWRWSFDALNGSMYIGDVGQDNWEEIDIELAGNGGNNYGWRCYEGNHAYNTSSCDKKSFYIFPVYEYDHSATRGDCSIIGGFVYRGSRYPSLYGKYFFTDYCSGIFRYLYTEGGQQKVEKVLNGDDGAYTSFGENVNHELFVCNRATGTIYRITDGTSLQNFAANKNAEESLLSISPNPSKGNININYTSGKAQQIIVKVTAITGRQFYTVTKNVVAGNNRWNVNLLIPKGMYYLSIINNEGAVTTKSLRIE